METQPLLLPPLSDHGEVITFYAYRNDGSRSAALANLAVLLARRRAAYSPVLMIDWDLQAPALQQYFAAPRNHPGVLELFEACAQQLALHQPNGICDDTLLAYEVLAAVDWEQYVLRVDEGSQLYLMPAGRLDEQYCERLAAFDWEMLFRRCPALFRCFAAQMACHFRHILVDAESGHGDTAGLCTTLLPRKLVMLFGPERASLEGGCAMVRRAASYRCSHEDEQRPLLVYPVAVQLEADDARLRSLRRHGDGLRHAGYQQELEQLLADCYGLRQLSLDSYCDEVQLQCSRDEAQQLAVQATPEGDRHTLARSYETLLAWLEPGHYPWQSRTQLAVLDQLTLLPAQLAGNSLVLAQARLQQELGLLYGQQQRWHEALACFEPALQVRQQLLGTEQSETLASKAAVAQAQFQLGQLEAAQILQECVAEARIRLLGADHPDTLAARSALAVTLGARGCSQQAMLIYDEVLAVYGRVLGSQHRLTLACRGERAQQLFQQAEFEAARSAQEQLLADRKRCLGSEHADTLDSRSALAWTMLQLDEPDVAHSLLDAVLQISIKRHGLHHAAVQQARAALTEMLKQTGSHAGQHPGQADLVPELRQDGALDAYDEALLQPLQPLHPLGPEVAQRTAEQLLALDQLPATPRPPGS
ncbi:tetratricopeptide repeat protein [Pseudoduganella danionis]|uniref:tetratricopeptide repeat protein n=1 Tax=Pseudoduganella danionis TaxID=1890295 RepID=UPI0035B28D2E